MLRIADAIENLLNRAQENPELLEFDVLVVGSGYGGSISAALLAGCTEQGRTIRVGVLERGEEYLPGEFPSRLGDMPGYLRGLVGDRPFGQCHGLFDLRIAGDVHVLVGSGVGGGSLINAGVMEAPLARALERGGIYALIRASSSGTAACLSR